MHSQANCWSYETWIIQQSAQGMFECLTQHGCPDLTAAINPEATSCYRVVAGGFGDIWKGKFYNGTEIAIKVWRLDPTADDPEMNKSLKASLRALSFKQIRRHLKLVLFF